MVATITPGVFGSPSRLKWSISILLFAVGEALGGAATGALLGGAGWLLDRVHPLPGGRWWLVAAAALLYALHEVGALKLPAPSRAWQVPSRWRARYHPWFVAGSYGLLLGTGVLTRIETTTFFVMLLWCLLSASPLAAAAVFAGFGLSQALALAIVAHGIERPDDARAIGERRLGTRVLVHRLNGAVLAGLGIYLAIVTRL
jgi:hypothetical protein